MKKKKESKRMSSLDVFHSFIIRQPNGELTQENIISKPCFILWMQSRSCKPKHPAGAFRRTIHAHLRGADGRSPFDKDLEESLLKKLRSIGEDGKPVDPFAVIFGKGKKFKRNNTGGWCSGFTYPYGYHEKHKTKDKTKTEVQNQLPFSLCSRVYNGEADIQKVLNITKDEMEMYLKQAEKGSFHFSFAAVAYLVRTLNGSSYFFSPRFILPAPKEQYFRRDYPVWYALIGMKSEEILYMDNTFRNCIGPISHFIEIVPTRKLVLEEVICKGKVWFRGSHFIQGKRVVYIAYIRLLEDGKQELFYQLQPDFVIDEKGLNKLLL
eukprot:maker-scaffold_12-snap-gene-4.42-mRNA-1 protein AED:0.19 eAED:0.19 QI:81/0.75/0.6/1/1/1/5/0/322